MGRANTWSGAPDLAQTWTQVTGRGLGTPREEVGSTPPSQGVGPHLRKPCGRLVSAWAKEGVGHTKCRRSSCGPPSGRKGQLWGGGEFPVSISIQGGKQVTAGWGGCKQPLSPSVGGGCMGTRSRYPRPSFSPGPPPCRPAGHPPWKASFPAAAAPLGMPGLSRERGGGAGGDGGLGVLAGGGGQCLGRAAGPPQLLPQQQVVPGLLEPAPGHEHGSLRPPRGARHGARRPARRPSASRWTSSRGAPSEGPRVWRDADPTPSFHSLPGRRPVLFRCWTRAVLTGATGGPRCPVLFPVSLPSPHSYTPPQSAAGPSANVPPEAGGHHEALEARDKRELSAVGAGAGVWGAGGPASSPPAGDSASPAPTGGPG